jgi:hypothetical protein
MIEILLHRPLSGSGQSDEQDATDTDSIGLTRQTRRIFNHPVTYSCLPRALTGPRMLTPDMTFRGEGKGTGSNVDHRPVSGPARMLNAGSSQASMRHGSTANLQGIALLRRANEINF